MELKSLCDLTVKAVKEVGTFIQQERLNGFTVEEKSQNSLVTRIDKQAEQRLVDALSSLLPEAGILGEEGIDNKLTGHYNWIIDPLDGTTNFIHGIPCYGISVALMHKDELCIGVVYELNLQECFYAWKNGGAYLNENPIRVSKNEKISDALVATGFPYYDFRKTDQYLLLFKDMMESTRGIRRLGSAAVDLAYVACGRFDCFYEYSLQAWDVAAGSLIVQEAGGMVCDFSGGTNFVFGKEILASSTALSSAFLAKINTHF